MIEKVRITWLVSGINRSGKHRKTIQALGLKRLHQSREHVMTPQLKGMLAQVGYMCKVEKIS